MNTEQYFEELENWLDLEAVAEKERMARRRQIRSSKEAERSGETVLDLLITNHQTGLAGRILIDFAKKSHGDLPPIRLKVGSPVVICNLKDRDDRGVSGVVSAKRREVIQVAVDQWPDGEVFRIDLSPDETTRRRQLAAMARAKLAKGRSKRLRDIAIGLVRPKLAQGKNQVLKYRSFLNDSQQSAVRFAIESEDIAILHGPPGTGKTTTLAEVIFQELENQKRVLACAPSNTAVDNLLEKLIALNIRAIRVGHPARVFAELRDHTLDEIVDRDPHTQIILEMRREVQELVREAQKFSRGRDWRKQKKHYFAEAGKLRGQIRSMEKSIVRNVIDTADVICTTTTIDDDLLSDGEFDVVVIDEACQATAPGMWQALLRGKKIILAGDHQQLPPTVLSAEAASRGMQRSMMEEILEREGSSVFRRLTVQYRMHEKIMDFPSQFFYDSELIADPSVAHHKLTDHPTIESSHLTESPLLFIDTAGADFIEQVEEEGESKFNAKEATLVKQLVHRFSNAGVDPKNIAVIAPYAAQVRFLRDMLGSRSVEIDTVDGFQGREKDLVILTMVRSNRDRQIGFLSDLRRTNVAMTRAKHKLIMIGDSSTLSVNPFYAKLLDYFERQNSYSSVWEYPCE